MVADARILDLVTELMRKGHGEMRILKRIKRAASQNEVISVNERKYVESLMEKFLRASQKKQEPPKSVSVIFTVSEYDAMIVYSPASHPSPSAITSTE